VDTVGEGIVPGICLQECLQGLDIAANRLSASRHADIGGKDQPGMPATFDGPAPNDHRKVGHVVGYQCPLLLITDGKKGLVVLGLPASLESRDDIEAQFSKLCGDRRRVVMVESQFHARARRWRSQRARSSLSMLSAAAESSSTSLANSA